MDPFDDDLAHPAHPYPAADGAAPAWVDPAATDPGWAGAEWSAQTWSAPDATEFYTPVHAGDPGASLDDLDDHLWMHDDGRVWDLGPAEVDTDNDGVNDSLTRNGPGGVTVYTDSDRDGQVDKITEIDSRGGVRSAILDPETGRWIPSGSGRLDG